MKKLRRVFTVDCGVLPRRVQEFGKGQQWEEGRFPKQHCCTEMSILTGQRMQGICFGEVFEDQK